jgi:16S rRNA (cytosine1402-N4)-methyltransferase
VAARAEFSCFDGVLIDCGVNSTQLDEGGRGFSFRCDAPLDMRLDPGQALTAAAWVNGTPVEEMAATFRELGDVPGARRLARAIERARRAAPLTTTGQLAELAARVAPRGAGRIHPATRLFMAVRMRINEEIESLERGLEAAWGLLRPGGVLAVIGFCSPEHRVVKAFGRERARDYATPGGVDVPELRQPRAPSLRWITRKAVAPGAEELERNPRARSAQLRAMMKLTETGEAAHG